MSFFTLTWSNHEDGCLLGCCVVTLTMKAVVCSKPSVHIYQCTRFRIPTDSLLHASCSENLKSHHDLTSFVYIALIYFPLSPRLVLLNYFHFFFGLPSSVCVLHCLSWISSLLCLVFFCPFDLMSVFRSHVHVMRQLKYCKISFEIFFKLSFVSKLYQNLHWT